MTLGDLLTKIIIAALMGTLGQVVRTLAGLKLLNDWASSNDTSSKELFVIHRLVISLFIGAAAGIAAGLSIGIDPNSADVYKTLLGLAAAGYAGTDFIEAFIRRITPGDGNDAPQPKPSEKPEADPAPNAGAVVALQNSVDVVSDRITTLHNMLLPAQLQFAANIIPAAAFVAQEDLIDSITPDMVKKLFPSAPILPITKHVPSVINGLKQYELTDRWMIIMALSTIRAETEGFVPISEYISKYNTRTYPFDLYEPGTHAGDNLGNTQPGDGARFKGRGFVQLTGRTNYTDTKSNINIDLVAHPDFANDSRIAGIILADFLKRHEHRIRAALANNDMREARRAVNGGSHGLDKFTEAFRLGQKALPRSSDAAIAV